MSSPPNILDAYRTYSYHHILIAADSTNTAEALHEESEISRFYHPEVRFCPQQHPNAGRYIVLINGITDMQFVIQSAKWATVPIPSVTPSTPNMVTSVQTMAVDGEIEILEPQGVNFMNILVEATKLLDIDPALITFVLKTVFVGHRDDGTTSMITTVKPLMFMMVDITSKIDVTGAVYTMALVGSVNGAGKLPHINSVVKGMTINAGKTIGETLDALQSEITTQYDNQWEKLTTGGCGVNLNPNDFMKVTYHIHCDEHYRSMPAGDNIDVKYRETSDSGGSISNLGETSSIENLITMIMNSSSAVLKEANGKLPDERFIFKIASSVNSDIEGGKFEVHYHIHQYKAVVIEDKNFLTFEPPDGTGITFNYIFTGKNIDIKDLDIKMEYGLMFFQVLAAQATSPTSAAHTLRHYNPDAFIKGAGMATPSGEAKKPEPRCDYIGSQDTIKRPLFLGTDMENPMFRDTKNISASAGFNATLARHAMVENMGIKMTIRGNPQLLEESTQIPSDVSLLSSDPGIIISAEDGTPLDGDLRPIMPSLHKTPAYVKVNIWSPKTWTESAEPTPSEQASDYPGDYAQNLWYDGWYYMIQIDNVFEDGEFSQVLELITLPTEDIDTETKSECIEKSEKEKRDSMGTKAGGQGASAPNAKVQVLASGVDATKASSGAIDESRNNVQESQAAKRSKRVKYRGVRQ